MQNENAKFKSMGIFDKLFGSKPAPEPQSGDEIQRLLFQATKNGKQKQFEVLCGKNRELIRRSFADWKVVPPEYRNPNDAQHYANMLIGTANNFQAAGDGSLMEMLDFHEADEMFDRWAHTLEQAAQLTEEKRHDEAFAVLHELEEELKPLMGSGSDKAMAVLNGRKGQVYLSMGDPDQARPFLMQGYHGCQKTGNINALIMIIQDLAEVASLKDLREEERHWRIVMTNILLQVGNRDGAIQVRKHFGIEPVDELIDTFFEVE